jgi:hypothetical protein
MRCPECGKRRPKPVVSVGGRCQDCYDENERLLAEEIAAGVPCPLDRNLGYYQQSYGPSAAAIVFLPLGIVFVALILIMILQGSLH